VIRLFALRPLSHWKFISKFYIEINFEIFLLKVSTFTLEIYFQKQYVNNIVDSLFDVCKHLCICMIQSHCCISEIFSPKFCNIKRSKLRLRTSKFISFKSWLFTLEILLQNELIYIHFEINFQCERGLMFKHLMYQSGHICTSVFNIYIWLYIYAVYIHLHSVIMALYKCFYFVSYLHQLLSEIRLMPILITELKYADSSIFLSNNIVFLLVVGAAVF